MFCPFTFFAVLDEMIAEKEKKKYARTIMPSFLYKFLIVLDKMLAHRYHFVRCPVSQENNDMESQEIVSQLTPQQQLELSAPTTFLLTIINLAKLYQRISVSRPQSAATAKRPSQMEVTPHSKALSHQRHYSVKGMFDA